jgi:hypothetical protein
MQTTGWDREFDSASRPTGVPRRLRERIFAHLGASEEVRRDPVGSLSMKVAEWAMGLYLRRHYPALMIRHPLPRPLAPARFEALVTEHGAHHGVRLKFQ